MTPIYPPALDSLFAQDSVDAEIAAPSSRRPSSRPSLTCEPFVAAEEKMATSIRDFCTRMHALNGAEDREAIEIVEASWREIVADLDSEELGFDEDAVVVLGAAFRRWMPRVQPQRRHAILPRYTAVAVALARDVVLGDELACMPSFRPTVDVLVDRDGQLTLLRAEHRRRATRPARIASIRPPQPSAP